MALASVLQKLSIAVNRTASTLERRVEPQRQAPRSDGFDLQRQRQSAAKLERDRSFVTGLYQQLLGREPDVEGMASHMNGLANGMRHEDILQVFLTSPEYRARLAAPQQVTQPTQPPAQPERPLVGPVPLEGYDATKLNNPDHQTVKYLFGRVASHHALAGVKDKASAQALLESMVPELEAAGLKVHEVQGDKIRVDTELGQEWVDVVRGAGGGNPGWWWGSEGKAIPGTQPGTPTAPTTPGTPGTTPREPGAPLSTVPLKPEYANIPLDTSSPSAAAKSAAQWVRQNHPEFFDKGDDRQVAFEMMTWVVGALRAHGYDATRVVNHPDRPVGDGLRYGSDAVVLNGRIYDVYVAWGDPGRGDPVANDVGPYAAGRLRE